MINLAEMKTNHSHYYSYGDLFPSAICKLLHPGDNPFMHRLYALIIILYRGIFIGSLMCMSMSVNAKAAESDGLQHFFAETAICSATMVYTESWWQTMLVGLSIGVLKETYDASKEGNTFSKRDMSANMLGCITGMTFGATLLHFRYESETDTAIIGIEGKF